MEDSSGSRKAMARWDSTTDRLLISEVLRHLRNGEGANKNFSLKIWNLIAGRINEPSVALGNPTLSVSQVKNRYFVMKRGWKDFTGLLKTNGFHWNQERGTVDAEKVVWARYLRSHPKARVFKHKPLENFEDLCKIFDDTEQTTSARSSQGGEHSGGQADEEDGEDEEAEAEGNEERGFSAERSQASQRTYQDSLIPNHSGAQESEENLPIRSIQTPRPLATPSGAWRSRSHYPSYSHDSASPGSWGGESYSTADSGHHGYDYPSPPGRRYNTGSTSYYRNDYRSPTFRRYNGSRYYRDNHPSPASRRYITGDSRRYRNDYYSPAVRRCNSVGSGYYRDDYHSPAGRSYSTAAPGRYRNGYSSPASRRYNSRDLTEIADIFATGMDKLITTIKSHEEEERVRKKPPKLPARYAPYAGAVGKAVKLYHNGNISKKNFHLAINSLKHDPLECVAFWFMSDDLCIEWVKERVKESEKCAGDVGA